jgi:hypothetical protein
VNDTRSVSETDAGHPARGPALRANSICTEVKKLRIGGNKDEFLISGAEFYGTNNGIAVI